MASIDLKSKDMDELVISDKKFPQKFNYMKNSVVLVKLDDYQPRNVKIALTKDLSKTLKKEKPGISSEIPKGEEGEGPQEPPITH